jgi:hypothetical protein
MSEFLADPATRGIKTQRQIKAADSAGMPVLAIAFLILTAAVSLLQSHYRLLGGDDFLQLWTDDASTITKLLHVQASFPLVVDPFVYHAVTFAGIRSFGLNPFALRLPSLFGFLLMQVCVFYFVRRIATERAAVFALAFPALTGAFGYTVQIRPYGFWLGIFGLAMLSWQAAIHRETARTGPLVALALAIAISINTHYYGFLLLVPLCAAELVRAIARRRMDVPVLVSMSAGAAGIVFLLPFLKGAADFRGHYQAAPVPIHAIPQTYNFILLGVGALSMTMNHVLAVGLVLCASVIAWAVFRQQRNKTLVLPNAELVFLLTTAGMPFISFLVGRFLTHAMEPRYVLGSITGISAILAVALVPLLRRDAAGSIVLLLLFAAFTFRGFLSIRGQRAAAQETQSSAYLSPQIVDAVMASPSRLLYTQDIDLFALATGYVQQRAMASHLALVYSSEQELRWNHSDAASRIALHLRSFKPYSILPYETVKAQGGEHIFVISQGGWNWIESAFAAEHVQMKFLGTIFGCEVVAVRFP